MIFFNLLSMARRYREQILMSGNELLAEGVFMCILICVYACSRYACNIYVYTVYVCVCVATYACARVCMHVCVRVCMGMHVCVCVHACICVRRMHVHIYVCMFLF